ncbi:ankyrin repeat domain-containing protein [Noviherbaspirillum sp. CPCC 100848]|uniref:Ankyrin repeat domain-containing protein n=1 Tax=Noviherbaspirillum album TaxID=3080276 RepID=A0ABU6JKG3_9BURK|nr:ankyrin repeat domain-containing protein [Noviherbaspirillum sp. CPCC 100848]MEC4723762.1 ankyrin repeat domain-containing protein [Noviherbaspirillum sp. CPCC 100848]
MYLNTENQTRQRNDNESFLAAASAGAPDTLALLLNEHGIDINTVDRVRQTALFHAIQAGCENCALYLLQRGIDWQIHNRRGLRALHLAAGMGLDAVINWLVNAGDDVNVTRANIDTPLIAAVKHSQAGTARYLLDVGANPNGRGVRNVTALHVANAAAMTTMLLAAGADPDARDKDGETPLFGAARAANLEMMRILVDAGADVDAVNEKKETALFQTGQRGVIDAVDYLLGVGANPDMPGDSGRTLTAVARRNSSLHTYMTARAMRGCIDAALVNAVGISPFFPE